MGVRSVTVSVTVGYSDSALALEIGIKAGLHGQFYLPAPCLPSMADKNGDAFTRQTCDLNKYSCIELSCVGGEFRVQRQYVSGC